MEQLEIDSHVAGSNAPRSSSGQGGGLVMEGRSSQARASISANLASGFLNKVNSPEVRASLVEIRQVTGGISKAEAVSNFVLCCIGAGIVVFPKVMAENGFLLTLLMLTSIGCMCYELGMCMIDNCSMTESIKRKGEGEVVSLEEMSDCAFGTTGTALVSISKNGYMIGCVTTYMVLTVQMVDAWAPWGTPMPDESLPNACRTVSPSMASWVLCFPLFLALSMIPDLKMLAKFAPFGSSAVAIQSIAIALGCVFVKLGSTKQVNYTINVELLTVGKAISLIVFGFDVISSLPSMRNQMAVIDELKPACLIGSGIVGIIIGVIMSLGYWAFGADANDNILEGLGTLAQGLSLSSIMGSLASGGILVNLALSCPLLLFNFTSWFESLGTGPVYTPLSKANIGFRVGVTLAMYLVGFLCPFVEALIGLVSSIFGCFNSVFFNLAMFHLLRRRAKLLCVPSRTEPPSPLRLLGHVIIFFVGIIACFFGTKSCVIGLLTKLDELYGDHPECGTV